MIFTLYYMYATLLQWWRIGATRKKLSGAISNQSSIVLYQKDRQIDGTLKIDDLIFLTEDKVGCTIVPRKKVSLESWLPFSSKNFFPLSKKRYARLAVPSFTVLIQADLKSFNNGFDYDQLQLNELGVPVAWTASDNFGVVLRTDLDNFSKLVSCFMANSIAINEGMEVLQVEMIDIEGEPKRLDDKLFKKIKWPKIVTSNKQWKHLIDDLRNLCKKVNQVCAQNGNVHKEMSPEQGSKNMLEVEPKCSPRTLLTVTKPVEVKKEPERHKTKTVEKQTEARNETKRHKSEKHDESTEKHKKTEKKTESKERHKKDDVEPKIEPKTSSKTDLKPEPAKTVEKKTEKHKKHHKKTEKEPESTESDSLEQERKHDKKLEKQPKIVPEPEPSDKTKNKRTKELTQEHKIKQSSSMDRIKHKDSPRKESHKTKREKFAKRYSDDRLLNKDVVVDKDISKIGEKKDVDESLKGKKRFSKAKPPNVLVCADSKETRENVKTVLKNILSNNKYTIYELPIGGDPHFSDNSMLVVVCGNVGPVLTAQLLSYFLNGGHLLCLCSDFLNSVLHTFTTAEVREHELVRFSYGEWKSVRMMHHIFCYQASPAKKHFSQDSDHNSSNQSSGNSPVAPRPPASVELHHNNKTYMVQVQVLGQEETWHTPSILLAKIKNGTGRIVFSQVHLEVDPTQYEGDETKFAALKESNATRLQIIKDILSNHLHLDCNPGESPTINYRPAYFLGRNDLKQELLFKMPGLKDNILRLPNISLQFCGRDAIPPSPTEKLLPVYVHSCPEKFSTVRYFENLKSDIFGRLVIYSDVMTSSMDVITGAKLKHGIVVIPYEQTAGKGRGGNVWLSPKGCAMFSIQLHIPTDSVIGRALPLVQHLIAVSVVSAIRSLPGYESIDIGLKWPNDIYANSSVKVGGLIVNSMVEATVAICNIGCGVNLSNSEPTTCINSLIRTHNEKNGTKLEEISFEKFFAITFTELERIYNVIQQDKKEYLYELYYKYWLHSDSVVDVQSSEGVVKDVLVTGIDDFGFLVVRAKDGSTSSVQPDNNTFDMMQGLIAPKIK